MTHLRFWTFGFVSVLFVGVWATALIAGDADLTAVSRESRKAEAQLLAGLHKPITADWSDVPLEKVLQSLATTAGANLWIDRETLTASGVSLEETRVNLHLGEVTVWQSLRFLLEPLQLAWHGSDGVFSITTQERADEILVTRTYDVQAIVTALEPQLKNQPREHFNSQFGGSSGGYCGSKEDGRSHGGGGGLFSVPAQAESNGTPPFVLAQFGGGGGGSFFGGDGTGIPIPRRNQPVSGEAVLAELLTELRLGRWEQIGGEGGTISLGRGRLIVRQNYQTHIEIRELLIAVEEFVVRESKAKSVLIARPGYPHDEDAAIFKRLVEPRDININDVPLDMWLTQLAKEEKLRLWIDNDTLTAAGTDSHQPVTLKLTGTSLATVLNKLLTPLALTSVVEEGTLVITTQEKADEWKTVRVSFTGDIPEARSTLDLHMAIQDGTSGKWATVDGEGGQMMMIFPRCLVLRQTQAVHLETAELLDDLRQAAVAPAEAAAPEIELRLYSVADTTAIDDLVRSLPDLIPNWDAERGSIVVLGQSLAIKQSALVHERLAEVFMALDQSHAKLNPPQPKEEPKTK